MKRIIFASHRQMASGMKSTIEFITGESSIYALDAYMEDAKNDDLVNQLEELLLQFSIKDKVLILTDMLGGSVNQIMSQHIQENIFVVCGCNIPLALTLALTDESMITNEFIKNVIEESRQQMIFMNEYQIEENEDDE